MSDHQATIEQSVAALHDAALQRRLALSADDDIKADRRVAAEVRQQVRTAVCVRIGG
jgi:hypothetical protein